MESYVERYQRQQNATNESYVERYWRELREAEAEKQKAEGSVKHGKTQRKQRQSPKKVQQTE